jgi:CBS domain-containing protein
VTTARTALHAGEIASAPVITVESDVDALAALRTMQRNQIRHLPVFAAGQCVGLVTEAGLLTGLVGSSRGPLPTTGDLAQRLPPSVDAGASRVAAARLMRESAGDVLLVMANAQVVGVLTAVDLVGSLAHDLTEE